VQALFKKEDDLLSEFKDFLQEIASTSTQGGLISIRPNPPDGASGLSAMWYYEITGMSASIPKGTQAYSL
jgi:hypothetical protein